MIKRYTFWLSAAVLFQFITGIIHSFSLFFTAEPQNETERQLYTLLSTYRLDAGAGFYPTFSNLFTALSSCFTFLCLFAAMTNGYLLWRLTDANVMRGIIGINVVIFGAVLVMMAYGRFFPPVVFAALIFVNLLAALIVVPGRASAE